jgi:hypothetical protein
MNTEPEQTHEQMQSRFVTLLHRQRHRSLWFVDPSAVFDIASPQAAGILDAIAKTGSREVWLEVRKLKRWRSQHFK